VDSYYTLYLLEVVESRSVSNNKVRKITIRRPCREGGRRENRGGELAK
jgi:hypothetical protein